MLKWTHKAGKFFVDGVDYTEKILKIATKLDGTIVTFEGRQFAVTMEEIIVKKARGCVFGMTDHKGGCKVLSKLDDVPNEEELIKLIEDSDNMDYAKAFYVETKDQLEWYYMPKNKRFCRRPV